jgi:large subunit ribosomal protein L5
MPGRIMNLRDNYEKEVIKQLKEKLGIKNTMAVPKLSKIVLNMGVRDVLADKGDLGKQAVIMAQIAGQKAKVMKAKKSISTFKLREGDEIALCTTLRGKRMYDFFDKLVSVVLPRIRDFRGVKRESFDGKGNYSLGFSESTVFPEIDPAKLDKIQGLEICIVTTAKNNEEGLALLEALGMPFRKGESSV